MATSDIFEQITVEVVYAAANRQRLVSVQVPFNSTAEYAIHASGLLSEFPEIDLDHTSIGIFASVCERDKILKQGDRVEIYRALALDPKAARLQRAKKN